MNKKICVYAICKNEMKFIDRWFNSVKEADYVCVLDTGSTDGSYEHLKTLNIISTQKFYKNFRFDVARNDSMKLIPDDAEILICIDIDEILLPGWSKLLKENWNSTTGRARYRYTWNFNEDGSEGVVFLADKIHKNNHFKWVNPVHEILEQTSNTTLTTIDLPNIKVHHLADQTKSRSSYLPLLELAVKENPENDRNTHYLGREYMFHKEYDKAIETLKKHLSLPKATWKEERSASHRYIAKCYGYKNDFSNQEKHLLLALLEFNLSREPYFDLALLYYQKKDYLKSALSIEEMLKITKRNLNYISSPICWGALPYDILSICYYELKEYNKALFYVNKAIELDKDLRLINNRQLFLKKSNEKDSNAN